MASTAVTSEPQPQVAEGLSLNVAMAKLRVLNK